MKNEIGFGNGRKHFGKKENAGLPAFSPFPTNFSKALCFRVMSRECVVKNYKHFLSGLIQLVL